MLRRVGWGVLALAVLMAMAWTLSRLWPLPEHQREQVRLLEDVRPLSGRNGFAALWTLPFDGLDPAQREAALAVDVRRWQTGPAAGTTDSSLAAERRALTVDRESYCLPSDADCLAKLRADPQRFSVGHAGHEGLHERLDGLADMDRFDSPFRPSSIELIPFPRYQMVMDGSGAHALAYVRGDVAGALAGSCRSVQLGRRLMRTGGTLVDSMIGAAVVRANVRLLAGMLAELPPQQTLPPACATALQPIDVEEQSLCRAMQGEFAMNKAGIDAGLRQRGSGLLLDREHTLGRIATNFGWACGPGSAQALAADTPVALPSQPAWDARCLANPIGCTLSDIAGPAYADYAARSQDAAAWLRLLGAQRWLRQQPDAPAQALARLPAQWRSSTRAPVLSADGRHLQVPRRAAPRKDEGEYLSLPLRAD